MLRFKPSEGNHFKGLGWEMCLKSTVAGLSNFLFVSWFSRGLFLAMLVSLLFLVLLRFTAGVLFWIFIFGVIGIIGYGKHQMLSGITDLYSPTWLIAGYDLYGREKGDSCLR